MKRLTQQDWRVIRTALNMISADAWDESSYGDRPDFESTLDKINQRIRGAGPCGRIGFKSVANTP